METRTRYIEQTVPFRKITAVLLFALFAALAARCVPHTAPVNIELTQGGEIVRAVDANGAPLQMTNHPTVGSPIGGPAATAARQTRAALAPGDCYWDCQYYGVICVCRWKCP